MTKSVDGIKGPGNPNHLDLAPKQPEQETAKSGKSKRPKFKLPKVSLKLAAIAIEVALVLYAAWFFVLKSDEELTNQQVIDKVSSLVENLPENETPTIATIEDAEAIAKQDSFYEGASDGDKVLVYAQNKRAIIYSPNDNRIVKDGAVSITN